MTVDELIKSLIKVEENEYELEKEAGEFTISASVSGDGVSVSADAEWLRFAGVSGSGENTTITIAYDENTGAAPREAVLTLSSASGENTSEVTVSVRQTGNMPETSTIATAVAGQGEYFAVEGTVSALCTRGFVLTDETASVLVYFGSSYDGAYSIGDKLKVVGEMGSYNHGAQFDSPDYVEVMEEGGDFEYPAAEELTGTEMDALLGQYPNKDDLVEAKYVKITGQISISENHYNLIVSGASEAQGSMYYPIKELGIDDMNGQTKTLYGYFTSISGGRFINLVVTSVE